MAVDSSSFDTIEAYEIAQKLAQMSDSGKHLSCYCSYDSLFFFLLFDYPHMSLSYAYGVIEELKAWIIREVKA